jgi:asparagine synthase (glutamine-hydrolysing)
MCGIIGVISSLAADRKPVEKALQLMYHRGPDGRGVWSDDLIILGHTRLSILDLSALGEQPMSDKSERFTISFNGEIYNYLELRQELIALGHHFRSQTDTEVLLAAYIEWGNACLPKLQGMFAFGIWDKMEQTLFLARDRTGEKPLYYYVRDRSLYFASELRALVSLLPKVPDLDPAAIDAYLHYQYVPEPRTPLVGIEKLPAAHYLLVKYPDLQIIPQPYWSLENIAPIEGDPIPLIRQQLDRTIELTLRSDVPVGVSLSGGIDSGAIASIAAPKYRDTLQAFSVGYPDRPVFDERRKAEQLAKQLGLPFYEVELRTEEFVDLFPALISMSDDPVADIAAYGHYAVSKLAADHHVKVVLGGIGGDELFWGYAWCAEAVQLSAQKQQILQKSPRTGRAREPLEPIGNHPLYRRLLASPKVPASVRQVLKQALGNYHLSLNDPDRAVFYELVPDFKNMTSYGAKLYTRSFRDRLSPQNAYQAVDNSLTDCEDVPSRICKLLFNTWLASNCLALGDRLSMASSVETRFPFLDSQLIDLVMGLRKAIPDDDLGYKSRLKSALRGIVPDEVLDRQKQGFQPPFDQWMRAILDRYLDRLTSGYLISLNIIDSDYLNQMLRDYKTSTQHLFMLYKLLLLEIWYQGIIAQGN